MIANNRFREGFRGLIDREIRSVVSGIRGFNYIAESASETAESCIKILMSDPAVSL
jgi:hypothetical protein